jgi:Mannosyltransferase (PIG-V)
MGVESGPLAPRRSPGARSSRSTAFSSGGDSVSEAAPVGGSASLVDRHPGAVAIAAAAAARLLTFAVAFAANLWLGPELRHVPLANTGFRALRSHPLGFFESSWLHWDAVWFLNIVTHGYTPKASAFFPLYPLTIWSLAAVVHRPGTWGILVSVACFSGALVILYRLVRDEIDAPTAVWAVVLLSFAPTSFYFQAVYSESMFLLLTVASFAAARRGRWLLAGAAGLLAALTRSSGILLLVPLGLMWLEQVRGEEFRLPGARPQHLLGERRARPKELVTLLLVPAGLALYMAYDRYRFGNALQFSAAERDWHRSLRPPWIAAIHGARWAWHSVKAIIADPAPYMHIERLPFRDQWFVLGDLTAFIALVLAVVLLAVCWRRLPIAYTAFAAASLLLPLCYPTPETPLLSMPRFVLVDFPLFIALAVLVVRRPVARWAVLAVMVAALVVLTTLFADGMWVA